MGPKDPWEDRFLEGSFWKDPNRRSPQGDLLPRPLGTSTYQGLPDAWRPSLLAAPGLKGVGPQGPILLGTLRVLPPLLSVGDLSYRSFQGPVPVTSQRLSRDRVERVD
jgi:hypothetical protein